MTKPALKILHAFEEAASCQCSEDDFDEETGMTQELFKNCCSNADRLIRDTHEKKKFLTSSYVVTQHIITQSTIVSYAIKTVKRSDLLGQQSLVNSVKSNSVCLANQIIKQS